MADQKLTDLTTLPSVLAAGDKMYVVRSGTDYQADATDITKGLVGLGNADNTSDADKPVSTATQTALDGKVPTTRTVNAKALSSDITLDKTDIGLGSVPNTDCTDASNISSGTLASARGGAGTVNGILKANGSGAVSAAVASTDYAPATSGSAILKGNGSGGFSSATAGTDYPVLNAQKKTIVFVIDGAGSAITTGTKKASVRFPWAGTITKATLLADQTGSIVVDVLKDTYANYPPTDADSITASAPPTISSATKSEDSTLTGWTTSVSAGDTFKPKVNSCTAITYATLILELTLS